MDEIKQHFFYKSLLITFATIFIMAPTLSNANDLEKVSLQLNWKYQFQFAGFIAAKEKGFYEDVGLDVELLEYENGIDVVDSVLLRKIQYGLYNSSILTKNNKILPSHLMASYFHQSPHVLAVSKDINTPNDLVGKKIMLSQEELQNTNLGLMFSHFYVTNENTQFIEPSFNINDFINNRVDAAGIYRTNELFQLKKLNAKYNIIDPSDYDYGSAAANLFTSESEWKQYPERTRKFTEASNKGWEYALSHQQEIINIIYNKYTQQKSIEALSFEAIETQKIMLLNSPIGAIDSIDLDNHLSRLKRSGLLDQDQELVIPSKQSLFTQQQLDYLNAKTEVTMCVDPDWMPFEKISQGNHIGIAANVFSSLQKKLPIPIRLIETKNWQESLDKAKSRDCDILSLASNTNSRKKYMDFTSPYISLPVVLATKNSTIFIDNIAEVKDKKLGIVKGYAIAEFLRKRVPDINIISVDSVSDGLERVESGELFGFIDNLMTIAYALQRDFTHSLKVSARLEEQINLTVATRNDETVLHDIFQILVSDIDEAQMQSFYNNWVAVKEESSFDYRILWLLFAFALFATLAFILSLQRLNKKLILQNYQTEQEKERFESLFKESDDGLIILVDGLFSDCNDAAVKMMGYDSKEDLIRTPAELSPKYQPDRQLSTVKSVEMVEICLRTGKNKFEWFHQKKDGTNFWVDVTLTRINYIGKIAVYVTWRDISYRKRLQLEQKLEKERFQILFEQSGSALLLIDNGAFIDCNEKAFKMLGYNSKKELIAKNPVEDISPEYQPDGQLSLQKCIANTEICFRDGTCQFEWLHNKKDGSEALIDVILTRLDYQDKKVIHVSWRDLTAQKKYESALIKATEDARQANEAKSAFLANMSHELRTPMHGILSFSDIGLNKVNSATKEELTRYFSNIKISGNRLLPLLNDLLDLSKIEAGKMEYNFKKGDLASVFNTCYLEQKQRLLDLELEIKVNLPEHALITNFDNARISQVITNLLSNAIKFSPENTVITVSIFQNENAEIVFRVQDEGIGIPESELEDVFDAFIQSSKTNTGAGGTGLGLAISRKIIEAHNGKIWAENNNDHGATVSFTLPLI